MSRASIVERLSHRGRKPKLTSTQENLVIGYALALRLKKCSVSASVLRAFVKRVFKKKVSKAWITRLMTKHRFSSQLARKRNARQLSGRVAKDALKFLRRLRRKDYPPDRILAMDETGLWSSTVPRRTYNPKGRCVFHSFFEEVALLPSVAALTPFFVTAQRRAVSPYLYLPLIPV